MPRRKLDQYPTPSAVTRLLLRSLNPTGTAYECCSGKNDITKEMIAYGLDTETNDIDSTLDSTYNLDACSSKAWEKDYDWVITNPPFNQAAPIVQKAYGSARQGMAFLLRLSFLEPCANRVEFLRDFPPTNIIVTPRISFTGNGQTDSVTTAWLVWDKRKDRPIDKPIHLYTREEILDCTE